MALKKKLLTNNVEAEYWKIVGFNVSVTGKLCQIFLVGYKDVEARSNNLNISTRNYMIKQEDFDNYIYPNEEMSTVANLYGYLKDKEHDFEGAEDI